MQQSIERNCSSGNQILKKKKKSLRLKANTYEQQQKIFFNSHTGNQFYFEL